MKKKKLILFCIALLCIFCVGRNVNAEGTYTINGYTITGTPPQSFTTNGNDKSYYNHPFSLIAERNMYDYHTSDNIKVFCLDRTKEYAKNANYKITDEVVDDGYIYIITHQPVNSTKPYTADELSWITQAAIWYYQDSNLKEPEFGELELTVLGNQIMINSEDDCKSHPEVCYSYRTNELWAEAKKLATAAKTSKNGVLNSIEVSYDGKYEIDKDAKAVKTSLISLSNLGNLQVTIDTSKLPKGTKIYTEAGQEISKIDANTKFYFLIPVNNVDNYSIQAKVTFTVPNYTYYKGYKYVHSSDNTKQPLVLVAQTEKPITGELNIDASYVNDTGSSISKSMYFVGFIILLCGAGIIYVNVAQRKQTNE